MKKLWILPLAACLGMACSHTTATEETFTETTMAPADDNVIYDTLPSMPEGTVYNASQILQMAKNYSHAPIVAVDHMEGDKVVVHCYAETDLATETYDWLTIDPNTGQAVNLMEEEIDLTRYLK